MGNGPADLRESLATAIEHIDAGDNHESLAKRLSELSNLLAVHALKLAAPPASDGSPQQKLHARTVADYLQLQAHLADVRALIVDRPLFLETLREKGRSLDSMQRGMTFVRNLDFAMQSLVAMMEYDAVDRCGIDVRHGFTITCGSTTFQRVYFGNGAADSDADDSSDREL